MGSYDGAEVCELIGIFMLSLIGNKYNPNNIGYTEILKKSKRLFKECLRT